MCLRPQVLSTASSLCSCPSPRSSPLHGSSPFSSEAHRAPQRLAVLLQSSCPSPTPQLAVLLQRLSSSSAAHVRVLLGSSPLLGSSSCSSAAPAHKQCMSLFAETMHESMRRNSIQKALFNNIQLETCTAALHIDTLATLVELVPNPCHLFHYSILGVLYILIRLCRI
jgi:hypothetical protein